MGLFKTVGHALLHFVQSPVGQIAENIALNEVTGGILDPLAAGMSIHLKGALTAQLTTLKPELKAFVDEVIKESALAAKMDPAIEASLELVFNSVFDAHADAFLASVGLK